MKIPSFRSPSVVTQSPEDIPPIDPCAILELELYARRVATCLDQMMSNLNTNLHKVSVTPYKTRKSSYMTTRGLPPAAYPVHGVSGVQGGRT